MPKANRTCYCCGRKYYYCPSCPDDRRDPRIFVMWDSELCKEIFNVLTNESTKKTTTLECKNKLIELGVTKDTILRESVRNHVDRVMSYEENIVEDIKDNIVEEVTVILEETIQSEEQSKVEVDPKVLVDNVLKTEEVDSIKKVRRTRKSSLKNKENSEVD